MKSRLALLFVCATSWSAVGHADTIVGNGKMVEQTRAAGAFSKVHVSSGIHATIVAGPIAPVVVRGEENIIPLVRVEVRGDALEIDFMPNTSHTAHGVEVTVQAPQVEGLAVSGGAIIDDRAPLAGEQLQLAASGGGQINVTPAITTRALAIDASGGALVDVTRANVGTLACNASGGAHLTISGKADHAAIALSGGSALDAAGLAVAAVELEGSGGSHAEIDAGSVRGALSGAATLVIPPSATATVATSGAASVTRTLTRR